MSSAKRSRKPASIAPTASNSPNLKQNTVSITDSAASDAMGVHMGKQAQPVIAKPMIRLMAMLYDGMLILALLFFITMILVVIGTKWLLPVGTTAQQAQLLPAWYQNLVLTPSFILTLIGFYGVFWRKSGQTLGMQTWRLKTMNRDGSLLTWWQAIKRILSACVLPVVCGLIGFLLHGHRGAVIFSMFVGLMFNYWFAWFNKQGLTVHDSLSNTVTMKMPKVEHEGLFAGFRKK